MAGSDQSEDRQSLNFILWLVWAALLFSLVIYGLMPFLIPAPGGYEPPAIARGTPPALVVILGLGSIALIPVLRDVRRRMFFGPLGEDWQPGTSEARSAYFTMALTSWVMCELVGVFGFIIYFLTYEMWYALPFVAFAAVLMLAFWPQPQAAE